MSVPINKITGALVSNTNQFLKSNGTNVVFWDIPSGSSTITATLDENVSKGMAVYVYNSSGVIKAKKAINGTTIWNGNVTNVSIVDTTSVNVSPGTSMSTFISVFSNGSGTIFFSANANNTTSKY